MDATKKYILISHHQAWVTFQSCHTSEKYSKYQREQVRHLWGCAGCSECDFSLTNEYLDIFFALKCNK